MEPAGSAARDWQAAYAVGETPWDKGAPHPALLDWLSRNPLSGQILVPGCGAGHDVRALSRHPGSVVTGLDLAPGAKALAETFPKVGRETYRIGDFLAWHQTEESGGFDAVFEHTCFCAIEPDRRPHYARSAAHSLKPGGLLLAIFYHSPSHGGDDSPPYGCSVAELNDLFGEDFELIAEENELRTFERRENREVLRVLRRR